jgi:thiol peroxidase
LATIQFKNSSYRTAADLPAIGSFAPDVSLVNTDLQDVSFANWMGVRKVLNIFVSVDAETCAKSVLTFDRLAADVDDVAMLMISYDLPFAHERFQKQHELSNVTGLSAVRHAGFGENYGVRIIDGPLAGMFSRAVVVLDENNTVVHREHVEDIAAEPDYRAAFRALGIEIDE